MDRSQRLSRIIGEPMDLGAALEGEMMHKADLSQVPFSPACDIDRSLPPEEDFGPVNECGVMVLPKQE